MMNPFKTLSDLSDHCQISLQINNVHIPPKQIDHPNHTFTTTDSEYKWSTSSLEDYKRALRNMTNDINKPTFEENEHGVTSAVDLLKAIILKAADHSLKKRPQTTRTIKKNPTKMVHSGPA